MKLVFTQQSIASLQECLDFLPSEMSAEKVGEIRDRIIAKADTLLANPYLGQQEEYLEHLGQSHRRVIEGTYKIIYRVEGEALSLQIFLTAAKIPQK